MPGFVVFGVVGVEADGFGVIGVAPSAMSPASDLAKPLLNKSSADFEQSFLSY